ncbi:uncharacterized protein BXZ73DRAFT_98556 [Epithele typhae]|uniref:uncharacterized protein n=1 Tax=Epithele typhae TaxID=378194 RepID=UPI002007B21E|nr:uncharacterized protein BXZ73DRAFT_98556 [Epithele typhae]KAH9940727.1 hypothetical protein BXZ73DRAFT_98556 [Epithele typhae]
MPMLVDTAELTGLAVEGPLYGVFLCMFVVCGHDLYRRAARRETRLSWPMVTTGLSLILLATARFVLNVAYVFLAFIHQETRPDRIAFIRDLTQPIFLARHWIFLVVQLIGDSFVIYRCWVVWGRNTWIVILPIILTIASNACGSYSVWTFNHLPNQTELSQELWIKLCFCLSLVGNALATSLLAYRIWSIDREVHKVFPCKSSSLTPAVRIILESGSINVAYLFAFVMVTAFGSEAFELMCDMGVSLTGIVFTIVILRAALRRHDDAMFTAKMVTFPWHFTTNRATTDADIPDCTMQLPPCVSVSLSAAALGESDSTTASVSGKSDDMDARRCALDLDIAALEDEKVGESRMPITIDVAELLGIAIAGPLYGAFLCLFVVCTYDLLSRRARGEGQINPIMVIAGVALLILATTRFVLDTVYVYNGFINHDGRAARLAFMNNVTNKNFIAKHASLLTTLFVGDSFMNYRCWVVWGRKWWIPVVPFILSLSSTISGCYTLYAYTHLHDQTIFEQTEPLKICFILSLISNVLSTSLLASRIWYVNRSSANVLAGGADGGLWPVVRIVLESGFINAVFLFAFVMIIAANSSALELVSEMAVPVTANVFAIVIFRVGLRRRASSEKSPSSARTTTIEWAGHPAGATTTIDSVLGGPYLGKAGGVRASRVGRVPVPGARLTVSSTTGPYGFGGGLKGARGSEDGEIEMADRPGESFAA